MVSLQQFLSSFTISLKSGLSIPEVNFLVNSVKTPKESKKSFKQRSSKFINLLFDLEQKDRALAGI